MERSGNNSGVNIFWRRGMMDACVQAVEWTIDENTTRIIEKNQNKTKDEDSIFVPAKCQEQTVKLTYIFSDSSFFEIENRSLSLAVQSFPEKCPERLEDNQLLLLIACSVGGIAFALLVALLSICLYLKKRRNMVKVDVSDIYGTYYEGEVEYSTVEVNSFVP